MGEIDLIFDDEIGICLCRDITDKAQLYHKGNRFERSRSVLRSKGDRTGDAPEHMSFDRVRIKTIHRSSFLGADV